MQEKIIWCAMTVVFSHEIQVEFGLSWTVGLHRCIMLVLLGALFGALFAALATLHLFLRILRCLRLRLLFLIPSASLITAKQKQLRFQLNALPAGIHLILLHGGKDPQFKAFAHLLHE